jgi:hypothetical protein
MIGELTKAFFKEITERLNRKKANPYYKVNYKKTLKTKGIIKRLK